MSKRQTGMRIVTTAGSIRAALAQVIAATTRRSTIPILAYIKLQTTDTGIKLVCTNIDVMLSAMVSCKVEFAGAVTVPARQLLGLLKVMPRHSDVILAEMDKRLIISCGLFIAKLNTLPVNDFPAENVINASCCFSMPSADLRGLIDRTRFAVSTEETRYYINGIYLHVAESDETKVLRAVATDGHRMVIVSIVLPSGAEDMPGVIVPREALIPLRDLLSREETCEISIGAADTKGRIAVVIKSGALTMVTKTIDGQFPDYCKAIPINCAKSLRGNASKFLHAVQTASAICDKWRRALKIRLTDGQATITHTSADFGECSATVPVEWSGALFEFGVNAKYLIDNLSLLSGDVEMRFVDEKSPIVIADPADASAMFLLMPMRL